MNKFEAGKTYTNGPRVIEVVSRTAKTLILDGGCKRKIYADDRGEFVKLWSKENNIIRA